MPAPARPAGCPLAARATATAGPASAFIRLPLRLRLPRRRLLLRPPAAPSVPFAPPAPVGFAPSTPPARCHPPSPRRRSSLSVRGEQRGKGRGAKGEGAATRIRGRGGGRREGASCALRTCGEDKDETCTARPVCLSQLVFPTG